jgi:hypothetical protein
MSEMTIDDALQAAQYFLMPFHLGADVHEGANAFLDHRPPAWAVQPDGTAE